MTNTRAKLVMGRRAAFLAGVMALGIGIHDAAATNPEYFIVDLGDLAAANEQFESFAFAINNDNVVVGMARTIGENYRAFIWLPDGSYYGLGDGTGEDGINAVYGDRLWSLGSLLGTDTQDSAAFDINDDGFLVGMANKDVDPSGTVDIRNRAFVWDPAGADPGTTPGDDALARMMDITTLLSSGQDADSRAYGISEVIDGKLRIVGVSNDDDGSSACADSTYGDPSIDFYRGFETELTVSAMTVASPLAVRSGLFMSTANAYGLAWGFDVERQADPLNPETYLDFEIAGSLFECSSPIGEVGCENNHNTSVGVHWISPATSLSSTLTAINLEHPDDASLTLAEYTGTAEAVNKWGDIVGAVSQGDDTICRWRAILWENGSPVDLHDLIDDERIAVSVALGVNNNRDIVGSSSGSISRQMFSSEIDAIGNSLTADGDLALLWRRDDPGNTWTPYVLDDLIRTKCNLRADSMCGADPQPQCAADEEGSWRLLQAFDINENGWIVGHGTRVLDHDGNDGTDAIEVSRGFVLIPISELERTCPWDCVPVNSALDIGNGQVTVDDLLAVINSFGAQCGSAQTVYFAADCEPFTSSTNYGNGIVNLDDMLGVLNNFGTCGSGSSTSATGSLALQLVDFSAGWMDETGTIDSASATAVATAWATFDASWDVYRVWVEVPDSTTYIDAVSGSEDNNTPALITNDSSTYYNNGYGSNFPPNPALFATSGFEALAFDTYLTIGNAGSGGGNPSVQGTIDLTGDTNSKSVGWYKTGGVAPVAGGSTGWRVLVGQFSVPDGEDFCISLHITGDGIDEYATVCSP